MSRIMTSHDDIREWAAARSGNPVSAEVPDGSSTRTILQITFDQHLLNTGESQNLDRPGGLDLIGWDEWFATFDAEKLALKVDDEAPGLFASNYEFVPRS